MKNLLLSQKGFAPAIILIILAAVGITGVGTTVAANNSVPGDPLFGLDKAIEEVQVSLATNDETQAKIKLEIAKERLNELETLESTNRAVDPAVTEAQLAISDATTTLSTVETKFKENKITLKSTDLQALLTELQSLLVTHQRLIKKVEIKIKDGEVKAKIKLFGQEASESAELIDDDLEDLEDDGQLNASLVRHLKAELRGVLSKVDNLFQLTTGGVTYTLTSQAGINLDHYTGKLVELKGTALNTSPTQITVTKIELEEEKEEDLEVEGSPEIEAKGFVRSSGNGFVLTFNGGTTLYSLSSTNVNLNVYVGKFVKVEGVLTGNVLNVKGIKVKQTSTPALKAPSQSPKPTLSPDIDNDDDKETPKPTSNGNSGSGSSKDEDRDDSDEED